MAVIIQGGTGSGYRAAVTPTGELKVAGTFSASTGSESFLYGVSGGTWMPLAVKSGTEAILRTDSSVSVTTGSEAFNYGKSGTSWLALKTKSDGTLVTDASFSQTTSNFLNGSVNITSGNNVALIDNSITTGSIYNLTAMDLTGTADGKFTLEYNGSLVSQFKTNAAMQSIHLSYNNPIEFNGGSLVVFVEHGELLSQGFIGNMIGYLS